MNGYQEGFFPGVPLMALCLGASTTGEPRSRVPEKSRIQASFNLRKVSKNDLDSSEDLFSSVDAKA